MNLKTLFSFLTISLFINCVGDPETVTISTPTIQCGMCQKAIEMGLGRLKELRAQKWTLRQKQPQSHTKQKEQIFLQLKRPYLA